MSNPMMFQQGIPPYSTYPPYYQSGQQSWGPTMVDQYGNPIFMQQQPYMTQTGMPPYSAWPGMPTTTTSATLTMSGNFSGSELVSLLSGLFGGESGGLLDIIKSLFGIESDEAKQNREFLEAVTLLRDRDLFNEADQDKDGTLSVSDLGYAQEILEDNFGDKYEDILDTIIGNQGVLQNANTSDIEGGITRRDLLAMKREAQDTDFELDNYLEDLEPPAVDETDNEPQEEPVDETETARIAASTFATQDDFVNFLDSGGDGQITENEIRLYEQQIKDLGIETVTIGEGDEAVEYKVLFGDESSDEIIGAADNELIIALSKTNVNGGAGNDSLIAANCDSVNGGSGSDSLITINCGSVNGGAEDDSLTTTDCDSVNGGSGDDSLDATNCGSVNGGAGNDSLTTTDCDSVAGGSGVDIINGELEA